MSDMVRYSKVTAKNRREIVLLKGRPCIWGRCAFCDYTLDNDEDEASMVEFNRNVLRQITGEFGVLEVINSGSVFELPAQTLAELRGIVQEKGIKKLFFEVYWCYRERLSEIEDYFQVPIIFKNGVETFDDDFRNRVLKKGTVFSGPEEVAQYFKSICLMVGIQGQSKEMIDRDMEYLQKYFEYGCVNMYVNNTTKIKEDPQIAAWFKEKYAYLEADPKIEVLWNNTDFGVGEVLS